MPVFRKNTVLRAGQIIRGCFFVAGLICFGFALDFVIRMPDTMPGPAVGTLGLLALGTIFILCALWIAI